METSLARETDASFLSTAAATVWAWLVVTNGITNAADASKAAANKRVRSEPLEWLTIPSC
jgi:hypothetical protein